MQGKQPFCQVSYLPFLATLCLSCKEPENSSVEGPEVVTIVSKAKSFKDSVGAIDSIFYSTVCCHPVPDGRYTVDLLNGLK